MVGSRTATALVGLVASLVITVAAWQVFDTRFVFFVLPFVPFLFRRRGGTGTGPSTASVRTCPNCGFRNENEEFTHCPRDGTPLEAR